ncbi:MAG: CHAT domain-containing protein [Microcoleaceae cyanobacterium]
MTQFSIDEIISEINKIQGKFSGHDILAFLSRLPFLFRVLYTIDANKILPSSREQQIVEQLLKDNPEQIDDSFFALIKSGTIDLILRVLKSFPNQAEGIAAFTVNFSGILCQSPYSDRPINVEIAIIAYESATKVFTREAYPEYWKSIQNDLGNAYLYRIYGEKAENLESAIKCYKNTLELCEANREDWAKIQINLGATYVQRIRDDKNKNLKQGIECLSDALSVITQDKFPFEWSKAEANLGIAHLELYRIKNDENDWKIAVHHLSIALEGCIVNSQEWAQLQTNIGFAYLENKTEANLLNSIAHSEAALTVFERESYSDKWAILQSNLGVAYIYLYQIKLEKELLLKARQYLNNAATVFKCQAFPERYAILNANLGVIYQIERLFTEAFNCFKNAIETMKSIREEITYSFGKEEYEQKWAENADAFGRNMANLVKKQELAKSTVNVFEKQEDKQKLAEDWNAVSQSMLEVCLELGQTTMAIEYAEGSKARNLTELILNRDKKDIFPPEVLKLLDELRDEIAGRQYQLQIGASMKPMALVKELEQLRREFQQLLNQDLRVGSDFQFEQFRMSLDERTAVVEFYIASQQLLIFIVTKTAQPIVLSTDLIDLSKLESWFNNYLKTYNQEKFDWCMELNENLSKLAKILCLDQMIEQIPTECDQLILVPHRYLHLLPLHTLPLAGDSSLFDRFPKGVSYAPSCQLMQLIQNRQRPEFTHLFAIQNPTEDLDYADVEVEAIQNYFNINNVLKQKAATKEAIDQISLDIFHCAHFSCHGKFNLTQPRKSALVLANARLNSVAQEKDETDLDKCMTLDDIFTLNLEKCRLVTLSACETGLIDFRNTSDEYIGLPSGFLYAGASNVVSSLWTAEDVSTAVLMIRFYQNLQSGSTVTIALNQAQLWLRDTTTAELQEWASELKLEGVQSYLKEKKFELYEQPYQEPYYWAAFCAIGKHYH